MEGYSCRWLVKRLVGGKKNDAKSHVDWKVAITCKVAWNEEGGVKAWPGSEKTASCCRRPLPLSLPSPGERFRWRRFRLLLRKSRGMDGRVTYEILNPPGPPLYIPLHFPPALLLPCSLVPVTSSHGDCRSCGQVWGELQRPSQSGFQTRRSTERGDSVHKTTAETVMERVRVIDLTPQRKP